MGVVNNRGDQSGAGGSIVPKCLALHPILSCRP
jgi:hypothetical protein